jgi:hypothetical protein
LSRHQLEVYLDKVFAWSLQVNGLPEGRQSPQHEWKKVFDAVFLGAACQLPGLHRIEAECRDGVLRKRIGPLSEDTIGYALQRQDPEPLFRLGCQVARRLKRNGVLRSDWARGRVVVAADGIETCSSFLRCCDACMERKIKHKVGEEMREDIQYYHRVCAAVVVSAAFPVPLGIRFQRAGETEVACTLRLLEELTERLGPRYFDVLVADALYLQTPFVRAIEALGLEWVLNLKDNQPELLAEAEQATSGPPQYQESTEKQELQLWHSPEVLWPIADRSVRVVKVARTLHRNRVPLRPASASEKPNGRAAFDEPSRNLYATNIELGSIPPLFVHQLGRSRWQIDAAVFQTITTDGHLKQPSVHQGRSRALVVLTTIRVLAYTLTLVFYHRQALSHSRSATLGFSGLARKLAYLFLLPPFDSS